MVFPTCYRDYENGRGRGGYHDHSPYHGRGGHPYEESIPECCVVEMESVHDEGIEYRDDHGPGPTRIARRPRGGFGPTASI